MAIAPTVQVFCNCTYWPSVDWIATVKSLLLTRFAAKKKDQSYCGLFYFGELAI